MISICFESSYKLASLDQSELSTLLKVYLTLYPKETKASLKLSVLYKKYKSLGIAPWNDEAWNNSLFNASQYGDEGTAEHSYLALF